jgi:hypothetical protein
VRLDQYVHRESGRSRPAAAADFAHASHLDLDVAGAARLGQCDERQATAGDATRISMSCCQCGMGDVVDAGADAVEQVVGCS